MAKWFALTTMVILGAAALHACSFDSDPVGGDDDSGGDGGADDDVPGDDGDCNPALPCDAIECPGGAEPQMVAGHCCEVCVDDAGEQVDECPAEMMCPAMAPMCDPGNVIGKGPGDCCAMACVPDPNAQSDDDAAADDDAFAADDDNTDDDTVDDDDHMDDDNMDDDTVDDDDTVEDCAAVDCGAPPCPDGATWEYDQKAMEQGRCCVFICHDDVLCPDCMAPDCPGGQHWVSDPADQCGCKGFCEPDEDPCLGVACDASIPNCGPGEVVGRPDGECCPGCIPDPKGGDDGRCKSSADCLIATRPTDNCNCGEECPVALTRAQYLDDMCWMSDARVEGHPDEMPAACFPDGVCDQVCPACPQPMSAECIGNACVLQFEGPPPDPCAQGRAESERFVDEMFDSNPDFSVCKADTDCEAINLFNACYSSCFTAINAAFIEKAQQAVQDFGANACGGCPGELPACPPFMPMVNCQKGVCAVQ